MPTTASLARLYDGDTFTLALYIDGSDETRVVDTQGRIGRPALGMLPSDTWRIRGAVRRNNFGHVVERYTLADVLSGTVGPWRYKNGAQRIYMQDYDHGTVREWRSPGYDVRRAPAGWNPYQGKERTQ